MVPSSPSRSLLLALLLPAIALVAWATWRARAAEQAAIDRARAEDAAWLAVGGADSSAVDRAATPTGRGELLRLELALAVPAGTALPALALRLRARDGAERPFDVTASDPRPRARFTWPVELPVRAPELPLRLELVGDDWCLGPGLIATTIHRLDEPFRLQLQRAVRHERLFQQEGTLKPLPDVEVRHESGAALGRSGASGRATFLRPLRDPAAQAALTSDELLALAPAHAPAWIEMAGGDAVLLRPLARGGTLALRVVAPDGTPLAGARVLPRHQVGEQSPTDPAARALFGALWFSRERALLALAGTTDDDGRCTLPWPWPCALRLRVDHRAHGQIAAERAHAGGESDPGRVTSLELRFPPTVECVITARHDGAPVAGLSAEVLTREFGSERGVAAGITAADGRVTLAVPAVAPLWLLLRGEGRAATVQELALAEAATGDATGGRRDLTIELAGARAVSGVVSAAARGLPDRDAAPPPGVVHVVQLSDAASRLLLDEVVVAIGGSFRLERVPTGREFTLDVVTPGGEPQRLHQATLPAATAAVELGELDLLPAGG